MELNDVKYALSDETIGATITALEFARSRYVQEATALLKSARDEQDVELVKLSRKLGKERLEKADATAALVDFYLHL